MDVLRVPPAGYEGGEESVLRPRRLIPRYASSISATLRCDRRAAADVGVLAGSALGLVALLLAALRSMLPGGNFKK